MCGPSVIAAYTAAPALRHSSQDITCAPDTSAPRCDWQVRFAKGFLDDVNATSTSGDPLSALRSRQSHSSPGSSEAGKAGSQGARQVVGVHIRAAMGMASAFGGCLPAAEYYMRAMAYFRKIFGGNVAFVYAAEAGGQEWFKANVIDALDPLRGYDAFPVLTGDPIETFAILSHCDASVFSYGSYGWFAAWLTQGPVTFSKHLESDPDHCDTVHRSGVGIKDHIPPQWIGL